MRFLCSLLVLLVSVAGGASPLLSGVAKAARSTAGAALGSTPTASEKESCFICELVLRKAASLVGPPDLTLSADDMGLAIDASCGRLPSLAFQACETLVDLKLEIAAAYLKRMSLDDICERVAQLCWPGLLI